MKRTRIVFTAVLAVIALSLAGIAAAAQPAADEASLVSRMKALSFYTPDEPINVRFSLENRGTSSVWVLRWQVPSDDIDANIFAITRDGEPVPYIGPLVKRAEPTAEEYIEIRAGKTLSVTFDPSAVYDMTEQGRYAIHYRVGTLDVRTKEPATKGASVPTMRARVEQSGDIGFWFEGLAEHPLPEMGQSIGGYTKCTTSQQSSMQTAHNNAVSISSKAKQHLAANPSGSTLYTYWFGTYTSSRFSTVVSHYNSIYDAFVNKSVVYDCGCKKNYYAYVYPSQPYKIYVCRAFWAAPNLGRDSRAGTLVHEMSHFNVTAATDDWVYGASGAHSLALSNPTKAIDNADNHEYFAEDQ